MKIVSVIIPVYNAERYLDRCLKSVCGQTYQDIEIILINDGSSDHSLDICHIWQDRDERINILNQANAGAGQARNRGLEFFHGDYVCFVDADDEIAPSMIEDTVRIIEEDASDLVLFGMEIVDADGEISRTYKPQFTKRIYDGTDIADAVLYAILMADESKLNRPSASCCVNLYRAELFRDVDDLTDETAGYKRTQDGGHVIRFKHINEIFSEDVYATLELYRHLKRVSVTDRIYYRYHMNPISSSHRHDPSRYQALERFYADTRAMYVDNEGVKSHIAYIIWGFIIGELKNVAHDTEHGFVVKTKILRAFLTDKGVSTIINDIDPKQIKFRKRLLLYMIKYRMYGLCLVVCR